MKRFLSVVLLVLLITTATFGSNTVSVSIPEFDVKVNGQLIDTEHSQYPVIRYKGITYFPMTSDYLAGIGLSLKWSQEDGLSISQSGTVGNFKQNFLGTANTLGSKHYAQLVEFPIKVNGKHIDNSAEEYPILLYKDITYFPMTWRFAVTEFGWQTKWDSNTGFEIHIKEGNYQEKENKETPTQDEIDVITDYKSLDDYTRRSNPARIGDEVNVTTTTWDNKTFNSTFMLSEIIRGDKAWEMISEANMFNDAPEEGYEYILAKFSVEHYDGNDENIQFELSGYDFTLVSDSGKDYENASVVEPKPSLDAKLYQGASNEGYVSFLVSKSDLKPLITYEKDSDGSGGVWFRGYSSIEDEPEEKNNQTDKATYIKKPYMLESDFSKRSNPVQHGDEVDVITTTLNNTVFNSTFMLSDIIRGEKAWQMISDANMFNDTPEEGYEYMLVKFSVNHYDGSDANIQFDLSNYDFTLVSESGKDYENASIVEPDPSLDAMLYQGASHEGYVAFQVAKTDLKPLIVYDKSYDGSGGVWFIGY